MKESIKRFFSRYKKQTIQDVSNIEVIKRIDLLENKIKVLSTNISKKTISAQEEILNTISVRIMNIFDILSSNEKVFNNFINDMSRFDKKEEFKDKINDLNKYIASLKEANLSLSDYLSTRVYKLEELLKK